MIGSGGGGIHVRSYGSHSTRTTGEPVEDLADVGVLFDDYARRIVITSPRERATRARSPGS